MLRFWARVLLGAMAMNGHSTFPKVFTMPINETVISSKMLLLIVKNGTWSSKMASSEIIEPV